MDTSYFFPNIGASFQQGVQTQQALQDQPYRLELLRQAALQAPLETQEKQFQLAQAYNQAGILSALNQRIAQRLNSQPQDVSPNDQPSATGGGGSSGGSVGSNAGGHVSVASDNGGTAAPSPASTPNGTAQSGAGLQIPQGPHYDPNEGLTADPMLMEGLAVTMPQLAKGLLESQESHQKLAQFQAQGPLNFIDSVVNNTNPEKLLMANPGLQARYRQLAPQFGIDPNDPAQMTTNNVRQVFGFIGNQIRGQVGLQPKEVPLQLQNQGVQQINPTTGKVEHEEKLQQVVGPNGPVLVPESKAVGMQPFNASIFGAANLTDEAKEFAYQKFKTTGEMPTGFGRSPAAQSTMLNYFAQRAGAEGDSATAIAARGQQFKASQSVLKDYESGQTGKTLNGLNTAITHMDILEQTANALGNGDTQVLNKVQNAFKTQFGSNAVTNFDTVKQFAAGEVAKAVLPAGGGEHEREEISNAIKNSSSPQQLAGALSSWRQLLAGKTEALRNQWDVGTNGTQGSFDKFLLPATKKALGIQDQSAAAGQHPAAIQSLLDKYK